MNLHQLLYISARWSLPVFIAAGQSACLVGTGLDPGLVTVLSEPDASDGDGAATPDDATDADGDSADTDVPDTSGSDDAGDTAPDTDTVVDPDTVTAQVNACGGTAALAGNQQPGSACGTCGQGVRVCDGPDTTVCANENAGVNELGSCELLPQTGEPCGRCGGRWLLPPSAEPDDIYCSETTVTNECGGCGSLQRNGLSVPVGYACTILAEDGIVSCVSATEVQCVPPDRNLCGGTTELPADQIPGQPCGSCALGRWTCQGTDRMVCDSTEPGLDDQGGDEGINLCGGCGPLAHEFDAPCGALSAGGDPFACQTGNPRWSCDDQRLVCRSTGHNACGGCGTLDGAPGDACEGGRLQCAGPDELSCVPDARPALNACGGSAQIEGRPGALCGECGGGHLVCAGPEAVACVGDTIPNDCGQCAPQWAPLGGACDASERRQWSCATGLVPAGEPVPTLVCSLPPGDNGCGGSASLTPAPAFADCGVCSFGRAACTGRDSAVCHEDGESPPPLYYLDEDDDGFGTGDGVLRCGESTDGYSLEDGDCDDDDETIKPDAVELPSDNVDQNCDGRELCFVDNDGDGFVPTPPTTSSSVDGDCDDVREAPPGYGTGDCDDFERYVTPLEDGPTCLSCATRAGGAVDCSGTRFKGVVINEYRFSASGLVVELYNTSASVVSLTGWSVQTTVSGSTVDRFVSGSTNIAPFGYQFVDLGSGSSLADGVTAQLQLVSSGGTALPQDRLEVTIVEEELRCRLPDIVGAMQTCTETSFGGPNQR